MSSQSVPRPSQVEHGLPATVPTPPQLAHPTTIGGAAAATWAGFWTNLAL